MSAGTPVNLRAGPGTNYALAGTIQPGESCSVQGRTQDGTWWEVRCADSPVAWVGAAVVQTAGDMAAVPVEGRIPPPPPTPTRAPTARPTRAAPSATAASAAATCQAWQGTAQFHNFTNTTVSGLLTRQADGQKASVVVPTGAGQALCLDIGRWTYTMSAPGWESARDTFDIVAGQTTDLPFSGACKTDHCPMLVGPGTR